MTLKKTASHLLTFLGVRGSTPCASPSFMKYGGHSSCVVIETPQCLIIFDAGSGIVDVTPTDKPIFLFLTHVHIDHILGFPFLSAVWNPNTSLHVYAGNLKNYGGCFKTLSTFFGGPFFPVPFSKFPARIFCHDFEPGVDLVFDTFSIQTHMLTHPNGAVGYKLNLAGRSICYVTDHEHHPTKTDQAIVDFIKKCDFFIYDSSYDDVSFEAYRGFGHSTWQEALRLGEKGDVGVTFLFHHDYKKNDVQMKSIEENPLMKNSRCCISRQGMKLDLITREIFFPCYCS